MNLTKEAKIHLATKVDNYKLLKINSTSYRRKDSDTLAFSKGRNRVQISSYNPHEIEGAKYLKDIWASLNNNNKESVVWQITPPIIPEEGLTPSYYMYIVKTLDNFFKNPENFVFEILNVTGYTGKVWEK